jgi:membrane dipeptidase
MVIDGLQCGFFDRDVFLDLQRGGFLCVTPTLGFWEGAIESFDAIARWRDLAAENNDVITLARNAADIERAGKEGKVAVLLGFQNSNCLDDRIRYVELFAELGVRILQLTYNNQNELGGSCYEETDSGLARFGKEVVHEMNRCGILVDLSHVGPVTTLDTILHSKKPVSITHANAASLYPHHRNKSDEILKALAERGGIIGCAAYRNIMPESAAASLLGFCEMVAKTVEIAGIDHVGIGTDQSHHSSKEYLAWMRMGRWSKVVNYGAAKPGHSAPTGKLEWLKTPSELGSVAGGLRQVGFNQEEVDKIMFKNWLRIYGEVLH